MYNYCFNNPIKFIDPDGNFVLPAYNKEKMGITEDAYNAFKQILENSYKQLVEGNPRAMEALRKSTGLSDAKIKEIYTMGSGPTITFNKYKTEAVSKDEVTFKIAGIEALLGKGLTLKEHAEHVFGTALTVIHEGVHVGDMKTNGGETTGQLKEVYNGGLGEIYEPAGKQEWKMAFSKHRGTDFELYAYGAKVFGQTDGTRSVERGNQNDIPDIYINLRNTGLIGKFKNEFDARVNAEQLKIRGINKTVEQHQKDIIKRFIPK